MRKVVPAMVLVIPILTLGFTTLHSVAEAAVDLGKGEVKEKKEVSQLDEQQERGRSTFRVYCASCHGEEARGDGPMVEVLKVRPADLTRLSRDNEGEFPYLKTLRAIDGRADVISHGSRTMPVWGLTFRCLDCDTDQDKEVRERIQDLLAYLETLQD
ncbi:MAG: cytochrome c [Acidobacteria bacterium]|nr:cytochrome c [Acidobacteriota bacterium]